MDDHTKLPSQICPFCGYRFDAATGLDPDTIPKAGDISLCLCCMEIGIYDEQLFVRKATSDELADIHNSASWEKIEKAQNISRWRDRRHG